MENSTSKTLPKFTIIHFNDVYEIQPDKNQICGGVSRFDTLIKSYSTQNPIVLFSGDVWNPSKLGSEFKGQQCVVPLNTLGVECACLGNHDLDFGDEYASKLNEQCNFPWLLTNVRNLDGSRLASCVDYHIFEHQGIKIGCLGIGEEDWLTSLSEIDYEDLAYTDFIESTQYYSHKLREEHKCDFVIALTHMRIPNDQLLCAVTKCVDLVLGGHDHVYY